MTVKKKAVLTRPSRVGHASFDVLLHRHFTAGDVAVSIEVANFGHESKNLKPSLQIIASALNNGLWTLLDEDLLARNASNAVLTTYLEEVSNAARNLLNLLDQRNDPIAILGPASLEERGHIGHGLESLQAIVANYLPETWYPEGWRSVDGESQGLSREWLLTKLDVAPDAIAIIQLLGQFGSERAKLRKASSGRKADTTSDRFFDLLACIFFATFGISPDVGSMRVDPASGSLRWIRFVTKRLHTNAREILNSVTARSNANAQNSLNSYFSLIMRMDALADATKADYLAAGWRRWHKLPQERKWSERLWWPDGTPRSSSDLVPKWLADTAIATPKEAGV